MTCQMEKEILEQPKVIGDLIKRYITEDNKVAFQIPQGVKKLTFIASGSSYHCAGMVAKIFREYANIKASCEYASEFFISKNLFIEESMLYIFISQSGETYDTVESLKKVKEQGGKTLCITNGKNSTIWNLSDCRILSDAGEERSIASTKALTAQLLCLYLIMLAFLETKGHDITDEIVNIKKLPEFVKEYLGQTKQVKAAAKKLSKYNNIVILGTKYYYSVAKEAALKIKETSYIDANAYPQGEFLHGHMAVLNNKPALIAIAVDETRESAKVILKRILQDYCPPVLTISNEDSVLSSKGCMNIKINTRNNIYNVFATVITFQVLAFEIARILGRNVDKPIGLSKVVK